MPQGRAKIGATWFHNRFFDEIGTTYTFAGGQLLETSSNDPARTKQQGVEAYASARLGALRFDLAYTYLHAPPVRSWGGRHGLAIDRQAHLRQRREMLDEAFDQGRFDLTPCVTPSTNESRSVHGQGIVVGCTADRVIGDCSIAPWLNWAFDPVSAYCPAGELWVASVLTDTDPTLSPLTSPVVASGVLAAAVSVGLGILTARLNGSAVRVSRRGEISRAVALAGWLGPC